MLSIFISGHEKLYYRIIRLALELLVVHLATHCMMQIKQQHCIQAGETISSTEAFHVRYCLDM